MTTGDPLERSDEALVLAFRSGDKQAFGLLYRRHAGAVATTARARGAPSDAVADTVQETFIRAITRLGGLRDPARFRPWLLAVTRTVTTDMLRRRVDVPALDADDDRDDRIIAAGPTPAELAELNELSELVSGCLAGLSVRDASALTMVSQLGFSTADVSAALGVADSATKVLLHRARRRLRDAVVRELLTRAPGTEGGCMELRELASGGHEQEARRHVASCATCQALARDQLGFRQPAR